MEDNADTEPRTRVVTIKTENIKREIYPERLKTWKDELKESKAEVERLREEKVHLEATLIVTKQEREKEREEIERLRGEKIRLETSLSDTEKVIEVLETNREKDQTSLERLREEIMRLQLTLGVTEKERGKIEQKQEENQASLVNLKTDNIFLGVTLDKVQMERDMLRTDLEKEQASLERLREEKIRLETRLNVTEMEREKMGQSQQKEQAIWKQTLVEMQSNLDAQKMKIGYQQAEHDVNCRKIQRLQAALETSRDTIRTKVLELDTALETNRDTETPEWQTATGTDRGATESAKPQGFMVDIDSPLSSLDPQSPAMPPQPNEIEQRAASATSTHSASTPQILEPPELPALNNGSDHAPMIDGTDEDERRSMHTPSESPPPRPLSPLVADILEGRRLRLHDCSPAIEQHLLRDVTEWKRREGPFYTFLETWSICIWQKMKNGHARSTWAREKGEPGRLGDYIRNIACQHCWKNRRLCCVREGNHVLILPHSKSSKYTREQLEFWTGPDPAPLEDVYKYGRIDHDPLCLKRRLDDFDERKSDKRKSDRPEPKRVYRALLPK